MTDQPRNSQRPCPRCGAMITTDAANLRPTWCPACDWRAPSGGARSEPPIPGHRSCVVKVVGKDVGGENERLSCVYLADGSKLVVRRGDGAVGHAWMEYRPQATLHPVGTSRLCPGCRSLDGEHNFGPTCTLEEP